MLTRGGEVGLSEAIGSPGCAFYTSGGVRQPTVAELLGFLLEDQTLSIVAHLQ